MRRMAHLHLLVSSLPLAFASAPAGPAGSTGSRIEAGGAVRFANALGSSMVLQQAPAQAQLWGTGPPGEALAVTLLNSNGNTLESAKTTIGADGSWLVKLAPRPAHLVVSPASTYTARATAGKSSAAIEDIVFGDVFVCGGQSNMQFSVGNASNASAEIAAASTFGAHVRLMTVGRVVAEDTEPARRSAPRRSGSCPSWRS